VIALENVPLDQLPIFGREGSWLPLGPVVQHTDELSATNEVEELWAFGDPDPAFRISCDHITLEEKQGKVQFTLPEGMVLKLFQ